MKEHVVVLALCLLLGGLTSAQKSRDLQQLVLDETPTAFYDALPVYAWVDNSVPGQEGKIEAAVIGTGFVANREGDFITAGDVAFTTEIGSGAR